MPSAALAPGLLRLTTEQAESARQAEGLHEGWGLLILAAGFVAVFWWAIHRVRRGR